jgi:hypothetical protein
MKQQDALKQPFFAHLLEAQKPMPAQENQNDPGITKKFFDDFDQTHKYPSDSDEEGDTI